MRAITIFIIVAMMVVLVQLALPRGAARSEAQLSPYAGQQTREIKALSAQEIDDLLNARGIALAKPAELNGYPGPLHAAELKDQLALSAEQLRAIAAIKTKEDGAARALGAAIVARERTLDQAFAKRTINARQLKRLTAEIGEMQSRLRAAHLVAHLETTSVFTSGQVARYNELRGYTSETPASDHDPAKLKSHGR